ncbi:MAG TPA: hypothetical protein VHW90_13730 [Stellaceae bacterium]|nr:hypothetical protein [Stellaceae bacterium]
MRLVVVGMAMLGLAAALSGCVEATGPSSFDLSLARVDPEEAAERAAVGAVAGAIIGTGIGAIFAINPAIGSVIGIETGTTIGAVIGVITTQPLPAYAAIPVPTATVIPGFYDTWAPGDHQPTSGTQVQPPHPS